MGRIFLGVLLLLEGKRKWEAYRGAVRHVIVFADCSDGTLERILEKRHRH